MRVVPLILALTACGGSALQLPTTTPQTLALGAEAWDVDSVTDLEVIHDIARGPSGIYAATSNGVYLFQAGSQERVTREDTSAVAAIGNGVFIGTGETIRALDGDAEAHPPIGEVHDLYADESGQLWAAGALGVARRDASGEWSSFGDAVSARRIFPGVTGELWIATARGLWRVHDNVIEEHGERSLPGPYVRSVLSIAQGRAFALVQDGTASYLSYYDSERWTHYTLADFDEAAVSLGRAGGSIVLFTTSYTLRIGDASVTAGVPLVALERSEHNSALIYEGTGGVPARGPVADLGAAPPLHLARIPVQHEAPPAPGWNVSVSTTRTHAAYDAWQLGDDAYVADANRGVQALGDSAEGRFLRTRSLLTERLRLVSDARRQTWLLSDDHQLGRWDEDHFELVSGPADYVVHALAADDAGVVIACVSSTQNVVTLFRRAGDEWSQMLQRTLQFAAPAPVPEYADAEAAAETVPVAGVVVPAERLAGVTHLAVRGDEVWLGIRVAGVEGERQRGAVVLSLTSENTLYHHSNAEGPGALRMPDTFENIELNDAGMAWFSTVVGAVRLGNSQAVIFGEARGVRGEVVGDVLVAPANKIWLAAAEGPGYYFRQNFEFRMPNDVIAHRPISLTLAANGDMWGAGPSGLVRYRDGEWSVFGESVLGEAQAISETSFVAVEGDAGGRVWALGRNALWIITEAPVITP
ncbi:MAG: hypothetical protein ACI9KE_003428 [Polyangiales bacterium]|jgi:hypothetical protein